MADKTSFTKDEWALLLRSPMNAGMAIKAAEPSGLFGLLKESFAGGAALAQAATDPNTNPLIKAVVSDFQTTAASPLRSRPKRSTRCGRSRQCLQRKLPATPRLSKDGYARSVKRRPRPHTKAGAGLAGACKSATPRRRHLEKSPARWVSDFGWRRDCQGPRTGLR